MTQTQISLNNQNVPQLPFKLLLIKQVVWKLIVKVIRWIKCFAQNCFYLKILANKKYILF